MLKKCIICNRVYDDRFEDHDCRTLNRKEVKEAVRKVLREEGLIK